MPRESVSAHSPPRIAFVSLGMLVLDELHLPDGQVLSDRVGGSGAWSMLGARMVLGPREASEVGSFVVAGHDFPESAAQVVRELRVTLEMLVDESRESTRGRLVYHDAGFNNKTFNYLTTPLQPTPTQLPLNLLRSESFHMLLPPEAIMEQVPQLLTRRREAGILEDPLIVWEPLPWKCTPEHLAAHKEACQLVGVFSPNHLELLGLYGRARANTKNKTSMAADDKQSDDTLDEMENIKKCADSLYNEVVAAGVAAGGESWPGHMLAVRCAEKGCYVIYDGKGSTFPPYHQDQTAVVDATGAGNAFLGALAVSLVRAAWQLKERSPNSSSTELGGRAAATAEAEAILMHHRDDSRLDGDDRSRLLVLDAISQATVVASFAIEQIGFPHRRETAGEDDELYEHWNEDMVSKRDTVLACRTPPSPWCDISPATG
ncbi:carbohydrate/purine kinase [Apiospora arundinis]|uniref:Carbohydrate/purine kinase n=1 Tax=Apiospora arundinis TaxID=335852 RepID=A0ABR2I3R0_9PEZI